MQKRIVITGCGAVGPLGYDLGALTGEPPPEFDLVQNTFAGKRGLREITEFPHDEIGVHVLGRVQGITPELEKLALTKSGRRGKRWWNYQTFLSVLCAHAALREAKLLNESAELCIDPNRIGTHTACDVQDLPYAKMQSISLGVMANMLSDSSFVTELVSVLAQVQGKDSESRNAEMLSFLQKSCSEQDYINAMISGMGSRDWFLSTVGVGSAMAINMSFGIQGPFANTPTACAASFCSLESAIRDIERGRIDAALTGGMWARLEPNSLAGLLAFGVIVSPSKPSEVPAGEVCKPFDNNRNGIIPSAGGAMFVIEELEHAKNRGATILAEICGMGASTAPHCTVEPDEETFVKAIHLALADAQISPQEIGHINAHATGTVEGDIVESRAILRGYGEAGSRIPVSALKGGSGHHILGSAAAALHVQVRSLQQETLFPNVNLDSPDARCPLNFVKERQPADPKKRFHAIHAAGFGGESRVAIIRNCCA